MQKKKQNKDSLSLNPELRICPKFDLTGTAKFHVSSRKTGVHVIDNCAEEHIM